MTIAIAPQLSFEECIQTCPTAGRHEFILFLNLAAIRFNLAAFGFAL